MVVSSLFNWKEAAPELEIAINNFWIFNPSESLDLEGERLIDWDRASGFRMIVEISGKNKP